MTNHSHLLSTDERDIQLLVRDFANKRIIPVCKDADIEGRVPMELYKEAFDMGLTILTLPEKYGGLGKGVFMTALVSEELARGDAGFSGIVAGAHIACTPIELYGTDYHWKMVADMLLGGGVMSFTLTEPNAGSDAAALRTKYESVGDEVIINGRKGFISNGEVSDMYTVFATKDPALRGAGISCFLVPRDAPGISIGKHEDKMGYRTCATNDVVFEDCRIPLKNMIGGEGQGMEIAKHSLGFTRPPAGAAAIGNAQYAFECAVEYAKVRTTFGKPISKNQGISFMLADMYARIEAGRQMVWHSCRCADAGIVDLRLASAAKVMASDLAMQACTDAVQVLGGYGYSREYPVEKRFRDAKIYQIFEGTNQIQRMVIASDLLHS